MGLFDINGFGKNKLPSIVKDPFAKAHCKRIYVSFSQDWFGDGWTANGTVEFTNGSTKGEQKFEAKGADAFDQVVMQMKEFMKELK